MLALVHGKIVPLNRAQIELSGSADFKGRAEHLGPMSDPTRHPSEREQCCVHWGWDAHRFKGNARVKVDVRVELTIDKVGLFPGNFFKGAGNYLK